CSVSELAPDVQQEFLGSLGGTTRKGGRRRSADVRLIACTHPKIPHQLAALEFLEDLYYRLNTIHLVIPPVRERPDDVPALVHHFLRQKAAETNRQVLDVSPAAMNRFLAYDWPGNLSEIEGVIDVLASSDLVRSAIHAYSLPADLAGISAAPQNPADTVEGSSISVIKLDSTSESLLEFSPEAAHDGWPRIPWVPRVASFGWGVLAGSLVVLA